MSHPITILLVDDHEVVRRGLHAFLEALPEFEVIAEASSGTRAIDLAGEYIPDVVLLDLIMPEMSGVEATRRIKATSPRTQVVILTSHQDEDQVLPALQAGAISYVLKDIRMADLAEAIRRAACGEATLHPRIAARVVQEMRTSASKTLPPYQDLTDRELDVLKLVAQGLNNQDIAERLTITENTVKGHVSNILAKLHLGDRTQAAVFAWREGLIDKES